MFLREPAADKRQDLVGVGGRDGIKVQEKSYYKSILAQCWCTDSTLTAIQRCFTFM